jgi:hypothetical protein
MQLKTEAKHSIGKIISLWTFMELIQVIGCWFGWEKNKAIGDIVKNREDFGDFHPIYKLTI